MLCRHEPCEVLRNHENYDFEQVRVIWVSNEHCWYRYRDLRVLLQGVYSVSRDSNLRRNDRDRFYAMLDVNRALYLTSPTHVERLASASYF